MDLATKLFEKHWVKKTGKPLDETTANHMQYAIDAINEALLLGESHPSQLLHKYFAWHQQQGYVSHKQSDIQEFLTTLNPSECRLSDTTK